jgi:hypothetical protein
MRIDKYKSDATPGCPSRTGTTVGKGAKASGGGVWTKRVEKVGSDEEEEYWARDASISAANTMASAATATIF